MRAAPSAASRSAASKRKHRLAKAGTPIHRKLLAEAQAAVRATSIRALAARAGIPPTTLAHWICGTCGLRLEQAERLAQSLGFNLVIIDRPARSG